MPLVAYVCGCVAERNAGDAIATGQNDQLRRALYDRFVATRLRKKCIDCGQRGNWPKTLIVDTCPECTRTRLHHDGIRRRYFDQCANRADDKLRCHPSRPPMCSSCEEYYASETHAFFLTH